MFEVCEDYEDQARMPEILGCNRNKYTRLRYVVTLDVTVVGPLFRS